MDEKRLLWTGTLTASALGVLAFILVSLPPNPESSDRLPSATPTSRAPAGHVSTGHEPQGASPASATLPHHPPVPCESPHPKLRLEQVCGAEEHCLVPEDGLRAAGHTEACEPLTVVRKELGKRQTDGKLARDPCGRGPCTELSYGLFLGREPRWGGEILKLCNDGYGAACVGEDVVEIGDNRFSHVRSGGSDERWTITRVVRLHPPTLLIEGTFRLLSTNGQRTESLFSWEEFEGTGSFQSAQCEPGQRQPSGAKWAMIPLVPLGQPPALLLEETSLGDCALELTGETRLGPTDPAIHIDRAGARGFVLDGALSAEAARLKILAISPQDFFIELYDPSPHFREVLTIASSAVPTPSASRYCASKPTPLTLHRLSRLHQRAAPRVEGKGLRVTTDSDPTHQTLWIHFEKAPAGGVAFWYDDVDAGKKVARTLSSVAGRSTNEAELGAVRVLDPTACQWSDRLIARRGKAISFPLEEGALYSASLNP